LLTNVLYKGSVRHKGTVYAGEQEAIVDTKLWEKVNRKLALNGLSQRAVRHGHQQGLLLKLVHCGECGAELAIAFTRKRQQRHRYYVCPESKKRRGCKHRPIAISDLDTAVLRRLEGVAGRQVSSMMLHQMVERVV
jgi:site-specific DNA recombinase